MREFMQAHVLGRECQATVQTVGLPTLLFTYDCDGDLAQKASVDGALPECVPVTLRPRILCLSHYQTSSRHPRERGIYDTLRLHFFWLHVASDVHKRVKDWHLCAQDGSQMKHKRKFQLFSTSGTLEFVVIEILAPLQRATAGKQDVVIVSNR